MYSSAQHEEMLQLAQQQCNGTLVEQGLAQLEALLSADAELRREYVRFSYLHAHLSLDDNVVHSTITPKQLRQLTPATETETADGEPDGPWSPPDELPEVAVGSLVRTERGVARRTMLVSMAGVGGGIALLAIILLLFTFLPPPGFSDPWQDSIATVTSTNKAQWSDVQREAGQFLGPGTLRLRKGRAEVKFRSGARVALEGPATFGLESETNASLFTGKLWALLEEPSEGFAVQARGVRVLDLGTEFGVEILPDGSTEVHCLDGVVETQARARLPMFYWNFDESEASPIEQMSRQPALAGPGATRVEGLVGQGAMEFDNSWGAFVNVGNGGGTKIGTGEFGASSGLTIEALTVVRWSGNGTSNGRTRDYDEIFRKEDGPHRMLLCFQNDGGALQRMVPPMSEFGPTLSFGLHLAGDGYSELEVRLDGQDGRPSLESLRDEKPHHVVATYDSWTGVKALYIDGILLQQTKFPQGTLFVSGGPSDAIIGNTAGSGEPYTGVIDEVAIYDFALTPPEVAAHWKNVQGGKNYYGTSSADQIGGNTWNVTNRLEAGQAMRFDSKTGLPLGTVPVSYDRFRPL